MNMRELIDICETDSKPSVMDLVKATREKRERHTAILDKALSEKRPKLTLQDDKGHKVVLSKSLAPDADVRLTSFENNEPIGHTEHTLDSKGKAEIITRLMGLESRGYKPV